MWLAMLVEGRYGFINSSSTFHITRGSIVDVTLKPGARRRSITSTGFGARS